MQKGVKVVPIVVQADLEKHLGENSFRADVVTCLAHLQVFK